MIQVLLLLAPLSFSSSLQEGGTADTSEAPAVTQEELESWTREVSAQVEELRATKFREPVSVAVADAETLMKYVEAREDKMQGPERRAADVTVAKMLGTIPADMDFEAEVQALLEGQVGGFYDPDTKGFYLMESYTGGLARSILAHELTHALDDQYFDIDGTLEAREKNADAQWAYQAVVEGSGTAVGNAWTAKFGKLSPQEMMEQASMGMDSLKNAIPYLYKPLLGAYIRGLLFLTQSNSLMEMAMAQKEPALETYTRCFQSPPLSSEQVLHPNKYWVEEERDDPVALSLSAAELPEGWSSILEQTLGEIGWSLVLEDPAKRKGISSPMAVMGVKYTGPASEGWGGDRFLLLGNGDARVLVCRTLWDTKGDAGEFKTVLDQRMEYLRTSLAETAGARELEGSGLSMSTDADLGVDLVAWIGTSEGVALAIDASVEAKVAVASEE